MKHLRKYIKKIRIHNTIMLITALLCINAAISAKSVNKSTSYTAYIERYRDVAVEHQKEYGIPASITLAQGLLESGAGRSILARQANNHFGIKCGRAWKGKCYYYDDDAKDECFRKYKNAAESFSDHAFFLQQKRYAPLFKLKITDYKGWAKGLKKCGYATDPKYADKLISIIERYELDKFDSKNTKRKHQEDNNSDAEEMLKDAKQIEEIINPHETGKTNGLDCIIVREGDTFAVIGKEFGISAERLAKFNDISNPETRLTPGEVVYIQQKNKKVDKSYEKYHTVKPGDSLQALSQLYGIRLSSLCKINRMRASSAPIPGNKLKLR